MELLLITGPAGVGKSTLSWEIGAQLAERRIAHSVIETDELDRVYPKPGRDELDRVWAGTFDVSSVNLAALWSTYEKLGHTRLIMSGVMLHLAFDRRWILQAIPKADITVVRLMAAAPVLMERLERREAGRGIAEQTTRSLVQAERMAQEADEGQIVVATDGQSPEQLAAHVLARIGWL